MLKTLFHAIRSYPEQALLLIYSTGVFAWLQTTSRAIFDQLGIQEDWINHIPQPFRNWAGSSLDSLQQIWNSSTWGWLIVSLIIIFVIRFIKGLLKFILILVVILGGLYLIWQNKEMLQGLV